MVFIPLKTLTHLPTIIKCHLTSNQFLIFLKVVMRGLNTKSPTFRIKFQLDQSIYSSWFHLLNSKVLLLPLFFNAWQCYESIFLRFERKTNNN